MLTYAFDLLFRIYSEEGYAPSEISVLILQHNLYGLDICPRAAQLAQFALVCKAREQSRTAFRNPIQPHVICLQNVIFEADELPMEWLEASDQWADGEVPSTADLLHDLNLFTDAENFGSLLQPKLPESQLVFLKQRVTSHWPKALDPLLAHDVRERILRVLAQAEALTQRYHVTVANPPYMGSGGMNDLVKEFVKSTYPTAKQDLMTCFMERSSKFTIDDGWVAMINLPSWLFIVSFEGLRKWLISQQQIVSLLHLGRGIFGSDFGTVAFVLKNQAPNGNRGVYRRLFVDHVDVDSIEQKERKFLDPGLGKYLARQTDFLAVPSAPIAYWLTERVLTIFREAQSLGEVVQPRAGISTGCNERFIINWYEAAWSRIGFNQSTCSQRYVFYPHNKAGGFRRWFGNTNYVLRYDAGARAEMKHMPGFRHDGERFYFKPQVSWGKSQQGLSVRVIIRRASLLTVQAYVYFPTPRFT